MTPEKTPSSENGGVAFGGDISGGGRARQPLDLSGIMALAAA